MRFVKWLFVLVGFTIFIPNVYADSIAVSAYTKNTAVAAGSEVLVNVNLKADEIIAECLFRFENDSNISYISMNALNDWSSMNGENGVLLSNSNISTNKLSNGLNILELKYKVNNPGKVIVKIVECVSINEKTYSYKDVNVNFSIKQNNTPTTGGNSNKDNTENSDKANNNITGIILSEGSIEFDPDIYEYNITVSDFNALEASVTLDENNPVTYTIDKEILADGNRILISVINEGGETKDYIIHVDIEEPSDVVVEQDKEGFDFVPIFIGIICLLVLINIIRIVKNLKK